MPQVVVKNYNYLLLQKIPPILKKFSILFFALINYFPLKFFSFLLHSQYGHMSISIRTMLNVRNIKGNILNLR